VRLGVQAMIDAGCEEIALEAEVGNAGALALYEGLGFVRDKRLHKCARRAPAEPRRAAAVAAARLRASPPRRCGLASGCLGSLLPGLFPPSPAALNPRSTAAENPPPYGTGTT
jgi:hypothetical protein